MRGWRAPVSGEELRVLAAEQAALRRVATLVARGTPPEELFAAVTEEAGRLLSIEDVGLGRYEPEGVSPELASAFGPGSPSPPGGGGATSSLLPAVGGFLGGERRHARLRDRPSGPDRQLCRRCLWADWCRSVDLNRQPAD